MKETILVVDDEKEIADLLELYIGGEGYSVVKAYTGAEALETLRRQPVSLALLDVMLPDISGFELCRRIREEFVFPIIMLTARTSDIDKINGLTLGADDYVTKPFNPLEVTARVKTQLRRFTRYNSGEQKKEEKYFYDRNGLVVDRETHTCTLYGKAIQLTPIEFDILCCLCSHAGRVVSSEELFEEVWKEAYFEGNNTVMAHIARLRQKLNEPPRKPKFIKTVWGVGYKIDP
ncbi:MAG: VanR-ABDEGLN family response regulator transcription factor [bacterium]|nr:VanR-ABDEGLN family response regulator transcription factor [Lachnospiraceae bacterium]MBQ4303325.1 VanR-ABDEGLN family response regulator transcription factor [Lachnospiraceae bacterium]